MGDPWYYLFARDLASGTTEILMATEKPLDAPVPDRQVPFSQLERLHAHKALSLYIKSLERSRANELHGSDIYRFRTADIALAEAVKQKLA